MFRQGRSVGHRGRRRGRPCRRCADRHAPAMRRGCPGAHPVSRTAAGSGEPVTAARETLRRLEACPEAVDWVGDRAPETAWQECLRGDWLLWYASQLAVDRRQLVRAACACARLVLHLVREGEERPRLAIDAAGRWADDPTEENRMAARDAGDAADTAAGDAADTAAYTAGVAAYSAGAAGVAAWVAGDAGVAAY